MRNSALIAFVVAAAAACGGGDDDPIAIDGSVEDVDATVADPDASPSDPDAGPSASCDEFDSPAGTFSTYPAVITDDLDGAGADVEIEDPSACFTVVQNGVPAPGADRVYRLDDLSFGPYLITYDGPDELTLTTISGGCMGMCDLYVQDNFRSTTLYYPFATGTTYLVVDSIDPPADTTFQITIEEATSCNSDFDCTSPTSPICDFGYCADVFPACPGDTDPAEPGDGGPAGATLVDPAVGATETIMGNACVEQAFDWYAIDVEDGGDLSVQLTWADTTADIDLYVHDSGGLQYGFSWWENPEQVRVTYLPAGRVYIGVHAFDAFAVVPYSLEITRNPTALCASIADCAAEYRNQLFRAVCEPSGACTRLDGVGMVGAGGTCDNDGDCSPQAPLCAGDTFGHAADTRAECTFSCTGNADCASLGAEYLCTVGSTTNYCLQPCTMDADCLYNFAGFPEPGEPWPFQNCDVTTGVCSAP